MRYAHSSRLRVKHSKRKQLANPSEPVSLDLIIADKHCMSLIHSRTSVDVIGPAVSSGFQIDWFDCCNDCSLPCLVWSDVWTDVGCRWCCYCGLCQQLLDSLFYKGGELRGLEPGVENHVDRATPIWCKGRKAKNTHCETKWNWFFISSGQVHGTLEPKSREGRGFFWRVCEKGGLERKWLLVSGMDHRSARKESLRQWSNKPPQNTKKTVKRCG